MALTLHQRTQHLPPNLAMPLASPEQVLNLPSQVTHSGLRALPATFSAPPSLATPECTVPSFNFLSPSMLSVSVATLLPYGTLEDT